MFSGYRGLTMSSSCCSVFIQNVVIRATVFFVFSALLSAETPLELRAQDFNFVIQAHYSSNLLIIYLHWTLLSVDIEPNKNSAFIIPGGLVLPAGSQLRTQTCHTVIPTLLLPSPLRAPQIPNPTVLKCTLQKLQEKRKTGAVRFFFSF